MSQVLTELFQEFNKIYSPDSKKKQAKKIYNYD